MVRAQLENRENGGGWGGERGSHRCYPETVVPKPQCDLVSEAVVQPAKWDMESAQKGI